MSFGRAVTPFGAALRFALVDQVLRVSPCGGLPSLGLRALLLAHRALMLAGVRGDHLAQLRITMFSRHTSVSSAATIEPPTTKDYLRFPTGTFSLPNGKPAGTSRRNDDMHTEEDREGRSAAPGGSGGGTQEDRWTEEDFKQRVRERLDTLEQHLDRIDQRLDRIEGHGEGPGGGRGGGGGEERGKGRGEERGRRRRGG
jgi:hypothetical protein